jgi:hypothetical protein
MKFWKPDYRFQCYLHLIDRTNTSESKSTTRIPIVISNAANHLLFARNKEIRPVIMRSKPDRTPIVNESNGKFQPEKKRVGLVMHNTPNPNTRKKDDRDFSLLKILATNPSVAKINPATKIVWRCFSLWKKPKPKGEGRIPITITKKRMFITTNDNLLLAITL